MKNADSPANPVHTVYQDCGIDGNSGPVLTETIHFGLTKREMFAMAALQGLCHATYQDGTWNHDPVTAAFAAVDYADALLAALEKPNEP